MPYDKSNPPAKLKGLSKGKQKQWVSVFNSCWSKHRDDKKCHMMAWGVVKKASEDRMNRINAMAGKVVKSLVADGGRFPGFQVRGVSAYEIHLVAEIQDVGDVAKPSVDSQDNTRAVERAAVPVVEKVVREVASRVAPLGLKVVGHESETWDDVPSGGYEIHVKIKMESRISDASIRKAVLSVPNVS